MEAVPAASAPPRKLAISPGILKEARGRVGLGRQEAWDRVNKLLKDASDPLMPEERFAELEEGTDQPTLAEAEALASLYLVPCASLVGKLPDRPLHDFRLVAGTEATNLAYKTLQQLSDFDAYYELARRLLGALGEAEKGITIPKEEVPRSTSGDVIESLGQKVRAALRITDELQMAWPDEETAGLAVQERIESTGVFVFNLPLPLTEFRGVSRWDSGGPPAILLNSADSPAARVFTLAHEYVHLMFAPSTRPTAICNPAESNQDKEERLANRVAAAALVPQSILDLALPPTRPSNAYRDWPSSQRRTVKQALKVSNDVIGIRLYHLGIVSEVRWTKGFWRQPAPSFPRGSRTRAERYRHSLGARCAGIARRALESEVVSPIDIAKLLDAKVSDVETAFGAS